MPERDEARHRAGGDRTHDRDDLEHPRHEAEQERERDLKDRQPDERRRPHHEDEEQLTAHVPAQQRVDLAQERNDLRPLARGYEPADPIEEPRRVAQEEEGRDEEHQELEEEVADTHDDGHGGPRDRLRHVAARTGDVVQQQLVEIGETHLVRRLGERALGVRQQARQRALQLSDLVDHHWDEQPPATENES